MFQKVLLAVDGSDHSGRAVPIAIEIAKRWGGEVIVFHAREHVAARGMPWERESDEEVQALVDRVCGEIREAGVTVRAEVQRTLAGRTARVIVDAAAEHGAGLIVMGSRGLTDLEGLLLGSVAHKVLQLTGMPVLVTR